MTDSDVLRDRLRAHVNVGRSGCQHCNPARGIYCPVALPDALRFAAARRDEVLATRLRRVQEAADRGDDDPIVLASRHGALWVLSYSSSGNQRTVVKMSLSPAQGQ